MAGRIDPAHDRVHLSRDELRVLARLERSLSDDARRAAAASDQRVGRLTRVRSKFRRKPKGDDRPDE